MLFVEFRFLAFFLLVFAVYWALRSNGARKGWLLACSYFFYGCWNWHFLALLAFSTTVDYGVGRALGTETSPRARRRWLLLSLVVNLGLLAVFKYYGFFVNSAADGLRVLGFQPDLPVLRVVLPVGISFVTFQSLSYTLDVYRGVLQPVRRLTDLALAVSFFPQLVAGPITRAVDFLPQLERPRRFADVNVRAALVLFLGGFIKKACISDTVAGVVDPVFQAPGDYGVVSVWVAVLFYAVQIYCDFSGYTDMARACAALLGYRLAWNFDFPYFAPDIGAFWRRWHMSLSTWLRDYLYIPLGGNHGSEWFVARNLLLTMLLGGLWHGAAWHFVAWGGLHGLALVVHRQWVRRDWDLSLRGRWGAIVGTAATFYWVAGCWIVFRAADLSSAWTLGRSFVFFRASGHRHTHDEWSWLLLFAALGAAHWISYRRFRAGWWERWPDWAFSLAYGGAVAVALIFVSPNYSPFIYFQF